MAAPPVSRIEWMDVLRGTSIVLVVFNHAVLFTGTSALGAPEAAWIANTVFAPARMPLMVFLSGLLVAPSLARGWQRFAAGKVRRVLWPYLVWSAIAIGLLYAFGLREGVIGGVTEHTVSAADLLLPLYDPVEHLWFLYDLFFFYLIALVTARVPPLWIAGAALLAAAIVPDFGVRRFTLLLAFFMVGVWFSRHPGSLERVLTAKSVLWAGVAVAARWVLWGGVILTLGTVAAAALGVGLRYSALSAPFAAGSIVIAIVLARRWGGLRAFRPLRAVGRDSLVFYIVHWWPTSAGVALGGLTGNAWIALVCGMAGGLGAGVATVWMLRLAPPLNILFAWPARPPRPLTATSVTTPATTPVTTPVTTPAAEHRADADARPTDPDPAATHDERGVT
ncbi:acyltransferase family protein [Microbacterium hominis]|uniref:Acyltransferase n=1 Tax=Microbacterium hominis TaxID=162426 RepID=A0A7D4PNH8_9MICO|nr:acyltransferase [Microbacterium hominis]QKJ20275.1 acyltransferase [Microbacterium hominis]